MCLMHAPTVHYDGSYTYYGYGGIPTGTIFLIT